MKILVCTKTDRGWLDPDRAQEAGVDVATAQVLELPDGVRPEIVFVCDVPACGPRLLFDVPSVVSAVMSYGGVRVRPVRIIDARLSASLGSSKIIA